MELSYKATGRKLIRKWSQKTQTIIFIPDTGHKLCSKQTQRRPWGNKHLHKPFCFCDRSAQPITTYNNTPYCKVVPHQNDSQDAPVNTKELGLSFQSKTPSLSCEPSTEPNLNGRNALPSNAPSSFGSPHKFRNDVKPCKRTKKSETTLNYRNEQQ